VTSTLEEALIKIPSLLLAMIGTGCDVPGRNNTFEAKLPGFQFFADHIAEVRRYHQNFEMEPQRDHLLLEKLSSKTIVQ
jgi:hypothetical protein